MDYTSDAAVESGKVQWMLLVLTPASTLIVNHALGWHRLAQQQSTCVVDDWSDVNNDGRQIDRCAAPLRVEGTLTQRRVYLLLFGFLVYGLQVCLSLGAQKGCQLSLNLCLDSCTICPFEPALYASQQWAWLCLVPE